MLTLIVARDRNGAIGRDGDMPWRLPEDLALFKRETDGGAIIMGRRTWESLPRRPLPNRLNIVVSRDPSVAELVAPDIAAAITLARAAGHMRLYGIGGARIYKEMLPIADRLLVTEVDLAVEGADTHFPDFSEAEWREVHRAMIREGDPMCVTRELMRA